MDEDLARELWGAAKLTGMDDMDEGILEGV